VDEDSTGSPRGTTEHWVVPSPSNSAAFLREHPGHALDG
jgi:hypothetical protein